MTSGAKGKVVLGVVVLAAGAALLCWFCESPAPSDSGTSGQQGASGEPVADSPKGPEAAPAGTTIGDAAPEPAESSSDSYRADAPGSTGAEMGPEDAGGEGPWQPGADPDDESWDGSWLTGEAMDEQDMASISPADAAYDPKTEARQLFHPFEMDLRAHQPLEPVRYKQLLGRHKSTNAAALRRVTELNRAGHKVEGKELYQEWSRLFELYRRKAYASQESRPAPASPTPR